MRGAQRDRNQLMHAALHRLRMILSCMYRCHAAGMQRCNKNGAKTAPYNKEKEERGEKVYLHTVPCRWVQLGRTIGDGCCIFMHFFACGAPSLGVPED